MLGLKLNHVSKRLLSCVLYFLEDENQLKLLNISLPPVSLFDLGVLKRICISELLSEAKLTSWRFIIYETIRWVLNKDITTQKGIGKYLPYVGHIVYASMRRIHP